MIRPGPVVFLASVLVGCSSGSPTGPNPHSSVEEQAVQAEKNKTPEQRLADAKANTMLPPAAKAALIQSLQQKYNLK